MCENTNLFAQSVSGLARGYWYIHFGLRQGSAAMQSASLD